MQGVTVCFTTRLSVIVIFFVALVPFSLLPAGRLFPSMVNVTVPVVLYQFTVAELLVCSSTASFGSIDVIAPQNPSSVIFDLLATSFDGTAVDVVVTLVLPHFALSFGLLPVVFGELTLFPVSNSHHCHGRLLRSILHPTEAILAAHDTADK